VSAEAVSANQVRLTWTKANNPVTYYLVTFGTKPGAQEYGNPNVGGPDTTTYTVGSLSPTQTYYFRVRAGNNCMPGDFSNELSVRPAGEIIPANVPDGFQAGVLGDQTEGEITPTAAATETPTVLSDTTQTPNGQMCQDPAWKFPTILVFAIVILVGYFIKNPKLIFSTGSIVILIMLLSFCTKLPWALITLGSTTIAWILVRQK
jgi:hypothetical protein